MKTTGPVKLGMSVGASASASLRVTSGEKTLYRGEVGDIDAENIADGTYGYGILTYVYRGDGQQFQVLNFWTDQFAIPR